MAGLNKRVLIFIDESGTAGEPDFMLGSVTVAARHASVAESILSNFREKNAGELHANKMEGVVARRLLQQFHGATKDRGLIFLNKASAHHHGTAAQIYAAAVIEIVKVAIRRYAKQHRIPKIGNIELILDRNDTNKSEECVLCLAAAQRDDKLFQAVEHIACVDSTAARFLQVADLVAYSRRWQERGEINGKQLESECGIKLL
ncbi:hypothetical protein GGR95_003824 [Sulfitobacter undariae]|uniref:DUF3800 domain-containing protein n=1 Tax=Sulfitobacter undariae TaxID=1563671 RepID=A0A7W6H1Q5_9RHOB|nr:DUF3800 domain-containing protein [Sulfitobacter undariae]MBB3996151.1 hypothetical protein [Sulfitobacter undariae]